MNLKASGLAATANVGDFVAVVGHAGRRRFLGVLVADRHWRPCDRYGLLPAPKRLNPNNVADVFRSPRRRKTAYRDRSEPVAAG